MDENQPNNLGNKYCEDVYGTNADPWNFEISPY